jgi:hypothetical protein
VGGDAGSTRARTASTPAPAARIATIQTKTTQSVRTVRSSFARCTPRGHCLSPVPSSGRPTRSFAKSIWQSTRSTRFVGFTRGDLGRPLALSARARQRHSTQYAARIVDREDGTQTVVYSLDSESKHVYRVRRDREWLDADGGAELRRLLAAY